MVLYRVEIKGGCYYFASGDFKHTKTGEPYFLHHVQKSDDCYSCKIILL